MKILYVENHAVFAAQVCEQFLAQHEICIVPSISDGRRALANEPFDLLIVDYDLDDGKGDELVRESRRCQPNLKIIGASSHDLGNDALLKAGAAAICGKMEFDTIQAVIARISGR